MDYSDNKPIYMQIADHFCDQILRKKWESGDRIPSVREIAVKMEVNPNTAIRAFHYLQDENVLYNERGVGYFISENAYEQVVELKREEFIRDKLPRFYRDMKLLGFSCSDLDELYQKHHGEF
ncbi:GntR family transcriptional regulator [Rhodohalobacter halophilus]|uniref:GntR family transcriptional regulator n=1 Tax=Rhodohalobacter halophilus TaxID=1812810 RepID=UPI00083F672D|nr:GntR family transcriptional regulator [Rhodohalobacter halophilus]